MRSHTWCQDLIKPRLLITHHRKNSVRDKVIGKKYNYLEKYTGGKSVGHLRRCEALKYGVVYFYRLDDFIG